MFISSSVFFWVFHLPISYLFIQQIFTDPLQWIFLGLEATAMFPASESGKKKSISQLEWRLNCNKEIPKTTFGDELFWRKIKQSKEKDIEGGLFMITWPEKDFEDNHTKVFQLEEKGDKSHFHLLLNYFSLFFSTCLWQDLGQITLTLTHLSLIFYNGDNNVCYQVLRELLCFPENKT